MSARYLLLKETRYIGEPKIKKQVKSLKFSIGKRILSMLPYQDFFLNPVSTHGRENHIAQLTERPEKRKSNCFYSLGSPPCPYAFGTVYKESSRLVWDSPSHSWVTTERNPQPAPVCLSKWQTQSPGPFARMPANGKLSLPSFHSPVQPWGSFWRQTRGIAATGRKHVVELL